MVAELAHHAYGLLLYHRGEVVPLRVIAAAHREILPYHYAVLVAEVEETVVLIDVAAPAADDVAVHLHHQPDGGVVVVPVAAVQGIHGHPVGPTGEHRNPVHDEAELPGLVRKVDVVEFERDLANAYAADVAVVHFPGILVPQLHADVVQGGLAIAARPPEIHVLQMDVEQPGGLVHQVFLLQDGLPATGNGDVRIDIVEGPERHMRLDVEILRGGPVLKRNLLSHPVDVHQADGIQYLDLDAAPESGAHEPGHYVPAVGARRTAGVDRLVIREIAYADGPQEMFLGLQHR